MTPTGAFDEILNEARDALGALMALNSSRVADTIDCISRLSAAEGRIAGFLEAIALTDPPIGAELFPRARIVPGRSDRCACHARRARSTLEAVRVPISRVLPERPSSSYSEQGRIR